MGREICGRSEHVFVIAVVAVLFFAGASVAQTLTESPYTVEPGHGWIEFVPVDHTRDLAEGQQYESWVYFDALFIVGILDNMDLQLRLTPHAKERFELDADVVEEVEGFGDVQVRSALNLWGNEDGATAFALIPYVQIPTGTDVSSEKTEGGVIAVLGWAPAERWWLRFQGEIGRFYDAEEEAYDSAYLHTAVVAFEMLETLGAYLEYVGVFDSTVPSDYVTSGGGGLRVTPSHPLTLYGGAQLGLSDDADDLRLFVGFIIEL